MDFCASSPPPSTTTSRILSRYPAGASVRLETCGGGARQDGDERVEGEMSTSGLASERQGGRRRMRDGCGSRGVIPSVHDDVPRLEGRAPRTPSTRLEPPRRPGSSSRARPFSPPVSSSNARLNFSRARRLTHSCPLLQTSSWAGQVAALRAASTAPRASASRTASSARRPWCVPPLPLVQARKQQLTISRPPSSTGLVQAALRRHPPRPQGLRACAPHASQASIDREGRRTE